MGAKAAVGPSARERLLEAANELFYDEGVHTVGIDRVIERAGVAKASLYNTFGSKDELVRAYLEGRHARTSARITRYLERYSDPRDRLLLKLRFEDGLPARAIGQVMGFTTQFHVYRRLNAVLEQVRAALRGRGVRDSEP